MERFISSSASVFSLKSIGNTNHFQQLVFAVLLLFCLGISACVTEEPAAESNDTNDGYEDTSETSNTVENTPDIGPCALTNEEVSGVIGQTISETFPQGNWGVASTCTYATASAPVAIEISSVYSTDLSSDRLHEGIQEISDVGDEAVWFPVTNRLSVVSKSKGKLLRIAVGLQLDKPARLEIAKKIARLALAKL